MDVYFTDSEQTDCLAQFEKFDTLLKTKKQDLIHLLLLRAFQYLCTLLDQCINTNLYTLPEDQAFPEEQIKQIIDRGIERLEAFHSEVLTNIGNVFVRGLFTKLLSKLDVEMKERITRIHYHQVYDLEGNDS